jgi:hypothetical protein
VRVFMVHTVTVVGDVFVAFSCAFTLTQTVPTANFRSLIEHR